MSLNPINFLCDVTFSGSVSGAGILSVSVNPSSPITIPAHATKALIKMWGGTGGSGGCVDNSGTCITGGSGAAGYLEKLLTGLTAGNTLTFSKGAAGSGGNGFPSASSGTPGTASVLSSGTQTISTLTAGASSGSGSAAAGLTSVGTAGGTASGGDLNIHGQAGATGFLDSTDGVGLPGQGGSTMYSIGADGVAFGGGNSGTAGGLIIMWFS